MNKDELKQYPREYIQEFLNNHGIIWDGVYHIVAPGPDKLSALANVELRKKQGAVEGQINLLINDSSFICTIIEAISRNQDKAVFKDYSKEWVEFLISKEPQRAYNIKKEMETYINIMHESSAKKIKGLKEQIQEIKKTEKTSCQKWSEILNIAENSIKSNPTTLTDDEMEQ